MTRGNPIAGLLLAGIVLTNVGCSLAGGTLGGREKCWPEQDRRAASLWRGTLQIDMSGAQLRTPEGESIPLIAGALAIRAEAGGIGELVSGDQAVAKSGDDVTLFGGAGSDGTFMVCAVEEVHARS